jgi:hypothetical protein
MCLMVPWSKHYLNTAASIAMSTLPTTDAVTDNHNAPHAQLLSRIHTQGAQVIAQFSTRLCNLECVVTAYIDPYHLRPQSISTSTHKVTGACSDDLTVNIYVPRLGSSAEIVLTQQQQQQYSTCKSSTTEGKAAVRTSTTLSDTSSSIMSLVSSAARESAVRKLLNCLDLNMVTETAAIATNKDTHSNQKQQVNAQKLVKQRQRNEKQRLSLTIKEGFNNNNSSGNSNMRSWLSAYTALDITDEPTNPSERVRGQPEVFASTERSSTSSIDVSLLHKALCISGMHVVITVRRCALKAGGNANSKAVMGFIWQAYNPDTSVNCTLHTNGQELLRQV